MLRRLFIVVFLLSPSIAFSSTKLDQAMFCDMTSTNFFYPLVQKELISLKPYKVEDSINYFRVKIFKPLSAFGMPVQAVFGWSETQMIFVRGPGTSPPEIYGILVNEGIGDVQATLNSVGATKAKVSRVEKSITAITCTGN